MKEQTLTLKNRGSLAATNVTVVLPLDNFNVQELVVGQGGGLNVAEASWVIGPLAPCNWSAL